MSIFQAFGDEGRIDPVHRATGGVDLIAPNHKRQGVTCTDLALTVDLRRDQADRSVRVVQPLLQTFKIEQEPLALTAPKVTEAVGTNLTAYNGRNGVHIEVDYVGNHAKHTISVCWEKPNGTCWPLASKPGSSTGAVIFALPPEAVIESMGKTVDIVYTVTTACKVQTSPPLKLVISLPVRLETPNVLEATPPRTQNAVLDLRTFTGNANSLMDPMWFLRAGQKCWLRAAGTGENGIPYTFTVYAGRTISAAEETAGVASPVLRSELSKLRNSTPVTLTFKVAVDGNLNENSAVVCPSRVLTVRLPLDDFTPFNGNNWNGWIAVILLVSWVWLMLENSFTQLFSRVFKRPSKNRTPQ